MINILVSMTTKLVRYNHMLLSLLYFIKSEFNTTVTVLMSKYRTYGEITFAANNMIGSHDTLLDLKASIAK